MAQVQYQILPPGGIPVSWALSLSLPFWEEFGFVNNLSPNNCVYHLILVFLITKEIFTAKQLKQADYNPILRYFIDGIHDKHRGNNQNEQENGKSKKDEDCFEFSNPFNS